MNILQREPAVLYFRIEKRAASLRGSQVARDTAGQTFLRFLATRDQHPRVAATLLLLLTL